MSSTFKQLQDAMQLFTEERDWEQFHTPKNLSMALTVEASELQEIFQWLTDAQSTELSDTQLSAVRDEIADVQLYLVHLASKLNVDIEVACWEKMKKNTEKYPVERVKGSARKYTSYEDDA